MGMYLSAPKNSILLKEFTKNHLYFTTIAAVVYDVV